jgi:hypothetical protein
VVAVASFILIHRPSMRTLITEEDKDALVSAAAQSDCGNRH